MARTDTTEIITAESEDSTRISSSVLVAEDDAVSRRILEVRLGNWGYTVAVVTNGRQVMDAMLSSNPPQLLLLDWMMPGLDGVEVCRRIRALNLPRYPYIVLLTARNAKQDLVTGLEAGADDYLTKPFHVEELHARLRAGNRILTLQKDLMEAKEQLQFEATHDVLTGIWNRRAIVGFLSQELDRARRTHQTLGLMLLDLDHFKSVNDTFGHAAGDAVLREVATRLVRTVRSYDWVGRYGGEEFLVILSNASIDEASRHAERLRIAISERPVEAGAVTVPVTVSIGATVTRLDCMTDQERLLQFADTALYRAKESGRNRTETNPSPS